MVNFIINHPIVESGDPVCG